MRLGGIADATIAQDHDLPEAFCCSCDKVCDENPVLLPERKKLPCDPKAPTRFCWDARCCISAIASKPALPCHGLEEEN